MIKITDISKLYEIEDGKLIRNHRTCPKCGPSYFLADHYDRSTCGNCGYTVFKRKGKKGAATVARRQRSPRKRTKSN